jgi:hypothetical protein
MKRLRFILALVIGIFTPISAFAEIADKMPSKSWMVKEALVLGALALALGLWRPWLALLPAAWAFLGFQNAWHDAHDPGFAEDIRLELGASYTPIAYATSLFPMLVAGLVIAIYFWRRRNGGLPPNKSLERTRDR